MRDERWLLDDEKVDEATQHSRDTTDAQVSSSAEEEREEAGISNGFLQLVDDPFFLSLPPRFGFSSGGLCSEPRASFVPLI